MINENSLISDHFHLLLGHQRVFPILPGFHPDEGWDTVTSLDDVHWSRQDYLGRLHLLDHFELLNG